MEQEEKSIFDEDQKPVFLTKDSMYLNSNTLFVEYDDIIRPIGFLIAFFLNQLKKDYNGLFDLSPIDGLDYESLWEWYINREQKNVLYGLLSESAKNTITFSKLNELENKILESIDPKLYGFVPELSFCQTLRSLFTNTDENIVHRIVIYYPYKNDHIKKDIENLFGDERISFKYGNIEDVLKDVSSDSTYVFSDITNIIVLEELNKLKYSSIVIPYGLQYNMNGKNLKINIDEYEKEDLFKLTFFNNL